MNSTMKYIGGATLFVLIIITTLVVSCKPEEVKKVEPIETEEKPQLADYHKKLLAMQQRNLGKYSLRGEDDGPSFRDSVASAIKLSISGKYDDSKQALLTILEGNPNNEEVEFQVAVQDFYRGDYANCLMRLKNIAGTTNSDLKSDIAMVMEQASASIDDSESVIISKNALSR